MLGDTSLPPTLRNPPALLEVSAIDRDAFRVRLEGNLDDVDGLRGAAKILRRWDRRPGAATGQSGLADDGSIELENGIEVQFAAGGGARYRSGDYWLVPARVATGDVRWPQDASGNPAAEPPDGVEHHYAPLAIVTGASITDCRTAFALTLTSPAT